MKLDKQELIKKIEEAENLHSTLEIDEARMLIIEKKFWGINE